MSKEFQISDIMIWQVHRRYVSEHVVQDVVVNQNVHNSLLLNSKESVQQQVLKTQLISDYPGRQRRYPTL